MGPDPGRTERRRTDHGVINEPEPAETPMNPRNEAYPPAPRPARTLLSPTPLVLAAALLAPIAAAHPVDAQRGAGDDGHRTTYGVEVFGGGVDFGPFMKLDAAFQVLPVSGPGPESEVRLLAERTFAVGGALTVQPWPKAAIRLGTTWVPSSFEFKDDSGLGTGAADWEGRGDLNVFLFDLSVLYAVLEPDATLVPYAIAGLSAGLWSPGDDAGPSGSGLLLTDDQDSRWRVGGVGGAGVSIAASDALAFRLEFATFAIGNPFDGGEAFVLADTGREKIDEPSILRASRLTAGVVVRFGGGEPKTRRRGGR
jgi:opacity protein-like surface antigen